MCRYQRGIETRNGFTLAEILVVFIIIISLALVGKAVIELGKTGKKVTQTIDHINRAAEYIEKRAAKDGSAEEIVDSLASLTNRFNSLSKRFKDKTDKNTEKDTIILKETVIETVKVEGDFW